MTTQTEKRKMKHVATRQIGKRVRTVYSDYKYCKGYIVATIEYGHNIPWTSGRIVAIHETEKEAKEYLYNTDF